MKGQAKDKINVKKQGLNLGSKRKIEVKPAVFAAGFVNLAFKVFLKAFRTDFAKLVFKTINRSRYLAAAGNEVRGRVFIYAHHGRATEQAAELNR